MLSPATPVSLAASITGVDGAAGIVRSTVTVTIAEVNTLPALSVVIARTSYEPPSTRPLVSHALVNGEAVSVAIVVHDPALCTEYWSWTVNTPLASAEFDVTVLAAAAQP